MREEERLTSAEREFEEALAGLQPAGVSVSRDAVMYKAGYAAGARRARAWQGATLLGVAAMAVLLVSHMPLSMRQGADQIVGATVVPSQPVTVPSYDAVSVASDDRREPSEHNYIALRNEVLRYGLAALPESSAGTRQEAPLTIKSLLEPPNSQIGRATPMRTLEIPGGRS
jgi:hypothetical protein